MMDCERALAELEAYVDGELLADERAVLEEHFHICPECFERGEFRRRLRAVIRRKCAMRVELPPEVAERVRSVLARSIGDEPDGA